jgi:hypothetical protein
LDPPDKKERKVTRLRSEDIMVSYEASDTVDHTVHCKHKSRDCCKLKPNVQMMNSVKSKTSIYCQHRPGDSPELHYFKEPSRNASTHANIKENAGREQCKSRLQSPLILSKKDTQSAVDFHQNFHCYMKSNPTHESTSPPWVMISK